MACTVIRRLPIALVYSSTAGWYLPVLKATFPSSLVFSAIVKLSCGSDDTGLGVCGGDVLGGDVVGGDEVGRGASGNLNVFEPDPDAWLDTHKQNELILFCPLNCLKTHLSLVPFGAVLAVGDTTVAAAAVPVACCRFFTAAFVFLFVIKVNCRDERIKT